MGDVIKFPERVLVEQYKDQRTFSKWIEPLCTHQHFFIKRAWDKWEKDKVRCRCDKRDEYIYVWDCAKCPEFDADPEKEIPDFVKNK